MLDLAPSAAVIIPTYGQIDYCQLAIMSAAASTTDGMVIIVDDGTEKWPGDGVVGGWCGSTPWAIRRREHDGNLSRSWNIGYEIAREIGCRYVVFGNSDLVFPEGWFEPIQSALEVYDLVGPVTNAPGHSKEQLVSEYVGYTLSDDPYAIQATQDELRRRDQIRPAATLNGFCIASTVQDLQKLGELPFRERVPMSGNEMDLLRRARSCGLTLGIAASSFVFHYRSVTRGLSHGKLDQGAIRLPICPAC